MTIIAGFSINKLPVLLGDLLLTGPEVAPRSVHLPTVGDSLKVKVPGVTIYGVMQKVAIVNDSLMIAWTGSAYKAQSMIRELRERITLGSFTIENLREYFETFKASKEGNQVQFVGTMIENGKILNFATGGEVVSNDWFGEIRLAGTGTKDAKIVLQQMELPTLVDGGSSPAPLEAVGRSLFLIGCLLQMEITNASTLAERYGAGYEIASIVNGRFAKIGDITYVFWEVDATSDRVQVSHPYQVFRYAYNNRVLAIRTARISPSSGKELRVTDEGVHLVESIFRSITEEDVELFEAHPPNLNSRFLVNLFLVRFRDGAIHWFNRVDYRVTPDTCMVFTEHDRTIEIAIEQRFLEEIVETLRTRIYGSQPPVDPSVKIMDSVRE